jgi:flagellar basal body L-ring protein FlgH
MISILTITVIASIDCSSSSSSAAEPATAVDLGLTLAERQRWQRLSDFIYEHTRSSLKSNTNTDGAAPRCSLILS